jgi:hypothetical protein
MAIQSFTSKHLYATGISTNSTQILSGPIKAHYVKNHGMLLWKLLSWHKRYNKLFVKIISIAHKYLTTYHSEGTNAVQRNVTSGATQFNSWPSTMFIICR